MQRGLIFCLLTLLMEAELIKSKSTRELVPYSAGKSNPEDTSHHPTPCHNRFLHEIQMLCYESESLNPACPLESFHQPREEGADASNDRPSKESSLPPARFQ